MTTDDIIKIKCSNMASSADQFKMLNLTLRKKNQSFYLALNIAINIIPFSEINIHCFLIIKVTKNISINFTNCCRNQFCQKVYLVR